MATMAKKTPEAFKLRVREVAVSVESFRTSQKVAADLREESDIFFAASSGEALLVALSTLF